MRKQPAEVVDVPIDFSVRLGIGETIVSATAALAGTGTIVVDPVPVIASPLVTCRVSGGTDGNTDNFLVLATTSTGEVLPALIDVLVTSAPETALGYATADDLLGGLAAEYLTQLTTDNGTVNPVLVDKENKDAGDWIDGYLGRYNPPMVLGLNASSLTMAVLRVHAVIVAKHALFGRKTAGDSLKQPDEDFQATKKYFEGIQGGKPLPGAIEPSTDTQTVAVTGASFAGEIVFDEDSGRF